MQLRKVMGGGACSNSMEVYDAKQLGIKIMLVKHLLSFPNTM